MLEFSQMTKEDLPFVCRLEQVLFSDPWSEAVLSSWYDQTGARGYLLKEDGVPFAYALFQTTLGEGELFRCGVEKDKVRKGFAFSLLSFALEKEKNENTHRIFLEVRKHNLPAKKLYEKLGFTFIGTRKNYYQKPLDDALIYEKIL